MSEDQRHQEREPAQSPTLRRPVYRTPKLRRFLGTGAVLGVVVGVLIDVFGPSSSCADGQWGPAATCRASYEAGSSLAYFVVLGALVGVAIAAILAALLAGRQVRP